MKKKLFTIALPLAVCLSLSNCADMNNMTPEQRRAAQGAAGGAILGGIIGNQSGRALEGAALGTAAGGGAGYMYGRHEAGR